MSGIFQKLNLKAQRDLVVVNAPTSFEPKLRALENVKVHREASAVKQIEFALAFVTKPKEVNTLAPSFGKKANGDALIWFAYPKASSKKYKCEFNRDNGWTELGGHSFEPVRMVAIDADWSALRFRRVEYIKSMTRSFAMTQEGKRKAEHKK